MMGDREKGMITLFKITGYLRKNITIKNEA
jgi:hypothetical protein